MRSRFVAGSLALLTVLSFASSMAAATMPQNVAARSARLVDEPLIDAGRVEATARVDDAIVMLPLREGAQSDLQALLIALHDPKSPQYHQWLTPEQFADRFGRSAEEIAAVADGLRAKGLRPGATARSRTWVRFSGSAAAVEKAFGSTIHRMKNQTTSRLRFAQAQSVPAIGGVPARVLLADDLHLEPASRQAVPNANLTNGEHALAPSDWATIYNVTPFYNAGLRGADSNVAVNIAVVGQSEIDVSDTQIFRNLVGLSANDPIVVNVGASPGKTGDQVEGDLDVQWAGAIAPSAVIRYYVASAAGLAALQAVDDDKCSIVSVSYGLCEGKVGSDVAGAYDQLWQQAATQGISVFVSSGDTGASGCESMSSTSGTQLSVNVMCTPYATCVGGTSFNDGASPATYWNATHSSATLSSARSYIPEVAWNESSSSGLAASGGGISNYFSRPSWQVAPGVPSGTRRVEPDIAANAAGHVPYIVVSGGGKTNFILGTSAAAPSVAGAFALLRQKFGRLGNVNPNLYSLARAQYSSGGSAVFHDITSGSNSVPGVTGYDSGTAYDMVTGLGSLNAGALLTAWASVSPVTPAPFTCVANATTACVLNGRFQVKVRYRLGFDNKPVDTDAFVKPVIGFSNPNFETAFFYFNDSNNIEVLMKMLDQGNTDQATGKPTIAVLFGSATPLRSEVTISDSTTGASKTYTSDFGSQAGKTDFTAFIK